MTSIRTTLVLIAATCYALAATGRAQENEDPGTRASIALRAGYGLPTGEWSKSRIAPDVRQFDGGISYGGDISFPLGRKWDFVLAGGYTALRSSRWEEFARSKGDAVSVQASLADVAVGFRRYLTKTPPDLLSLEFGAAGLFAEGTEVVNGERFEYDFFSAFTFGIQGALEYDRMVSDAVAFTLRAGAILLPDGMNYADGESRMILYFPMAAGLRFLF